MTGRTVALGVAMALLVLSIVVAIILIPWLDEKLRRAIARKNAVEAAADDNARVAALPREMVRVAGMPEVRP